MSRILATGALAAVVLVALLDGVVRAQGSVAPMPGSAEWTRCNLFNDAEVAWEAVRSGAASPLPLRSLRPPVLLPDGSEFVTWEQPAEHRRTCFVAQQHPQASDENPGTEGRPWKTISRAAGELKPGDRVIVKQGLYREWVRPARGGDGPKHMITYQAARGDKVIISGSEALLGRWRASNRASHTPAANAWMIGLPASLFDGYNPFAERNISDNMIEGLPGMAKKRGWLKPPYTLPRGLIFQDGRRLKQVVDYADLARADGTFWVEPGGMRLHVRPLDDEPPEKAAWEITTRPFALAPERAGLGFIRVDGFTVERLANCYPVPQRGAISTRQGHHWIIENNCVCQVNALGLDYGRRPTFMPYLVPADTPKLGGVGHIIRGNAFIECGVCSMSGLGLIGGLIEDNHARGCGWHRVKGLCEAAGIKLHYLKHALVRRNMVQDTINAHGGLWVDHSIHNSRVTRNVVVGSEGSALYLEASYGPNLIDQNILWSSQSGILLQHTGSATIANNLVGCCERLPVHIGTARPGPKGRMVDLETKRMSSSDHNRVVGNVFYGFGPQAPQIPRDMDNTSDYNLYVNPANGEPFDLAAWQKKTAFDRHSQTATAALQLSASTWTLRGTWPAFQSPRAAPLTRDYFNAARHGQTTSAGPFASPSMRPELRIGGHGDL